MTEAEQLIECRKAVQSLNRMICGNLQYSTILYGAKGCLVEADYLTNTLYDHLNRIALESRGYNDPE